MQRLIRILLITIAIGSTCAGLYYFYYGITVYNDTAGKYDIINLSYLGQFISGIVLSLFTLATFILIVLAYLNQREEIKHLQGMNTQQEKIIKAQIAKDEFEKFERTFYRLLDWHTSFMNSISYSLFETTGRSVWVSRGAINQVYIEFIKDFGLNQNAYHKTISEAIDTSFDNLLRNNDDMTPYFNNLYSVLGFVDSYFKGEVIEEEDSDKFISIVAGQLSRSETGLLCYYALYSKAPSNLKEIIENNGLLRNIDIEIIPNDVIAAYNPMAFK